MFEKWLNQRRYIKALETSAIVAETERNEAEEASDPTAVALDRALRAEVKRLESELELAHTHNRELTEALVGAVNVLRKKRHWTEYEAVSAVYAYVMTVFREQK
jgi:hypothetical protein